MLTISPLKTALISGIHLDYEGLFRKAFLLLVPFKKLITLYISTDNFVLALLFYSFKLFPLDRNILQPDFVRLKLELFFWLHKCFLLWFLAFKGNDEKS